MDNIEYTKRLEEILEEAKSVIVTDVDFRHLTTIAQDVAAIYNLNNEAIGETDIQVRGITQNKENPMYWTKGTKVDYELRQKLRNILGASNE